MARKKKKVAIKKQKPRFTENDKIIRMVPMGGFHIGKTINLIRDLDNISYNNIAILKNTKG